MHPKILLENCNDSKLYVLLHKITLPYPHKCLSWFLEQNASSNRCFLKEIVVERMSRTLHNIFGPTGSSIVFLHTLEWPKRRSKTPKILNMHHAVATLSLIGTVTSIAFYEERKVMVMMSVSRQRKTLILYAYSSQKIRNANPFTALLGMECHPSSVTSNPPQVSTKDSTYRH